MRARDFGLDVPDRSAAPATQYAVGASGTSVREGGGGGRLHSSVEAFVEARIAEATRLPDYKPGGDEACKAMFLALRGPSGQGCATQ